MYSAICSYLLLLLWLYTPGKILPGVTLGSLHALTQDGVSTHSCLENIEAKCPEVSIFPKRQKWEEIPLHASSESLLFFLHTQHQARPPGDAVTHASSLRLLMTDNLKCCHPGSPTNTKDSNFPTCYYEAEMMEGVLRSCHPST